MSLLCFFTGHSFLIRRTATGYVAICTVCGKVKRTPTPGEGST